MLEFTGERFLPEVTGQIALEHLHRYYFAARLTAGLDVLDIACGEGYGSAIMADRARRVIGVDISIETIQHARIKYLGTRALEFLVGDCTAMPLGSETVDVVVSFETIEHHDRHQEMMREIRRVLRPGGLLIMSSPDRQNYSIAPEYHNEFHVKELFRDEFEELLREHFRHHLLLGQKVSYGSLLVRDSGLAAFRSYPTTDADVESVSGLGNPIYWVALASDTELPSIESGLLELPLEKSGEMQEMKRRLAEREGQVAGLSRAVEARDVEVSELRGKVAGLEHAVEVRTAELKELRSSDSGLSELSAARAAEINELRGAAAAFTQALEGKDVEIGELCGKLTGLNRTLENRDSEIGELRGKLAEVQHALSILNSENEDLQASVTALTDTLAGKDAEVGMLRSRAAELQHALEVREAEIGALRGEIRGLTQTLEVEGSELVELRERNAAVIRSLEGRDTEIGELRGRLAKAVHHLELSSAAGELLHARLDELTRSLDVRDSEAGKLRSRIAESQHTIEILDAEVLAQRGIAEERSRQYEDRISAIEELSQRVVGLSREVTRAREAEAGARQQLARVYASRSWRATKGLRWCGRVLRSLRSGLSGARSAAGQQGADQLPREQVSGTTPISQGMATPPPHPSPLSGAVERPRGKAPEIGVSRVRILLVSTYCPSRAHAGGLRVLDIYALIRRHIPGVQLDLYTHSRPMIDWSDEDIRRVFDTVYWSPTEALSADGLSALSAGSPRYDVIDLQFHQAASDIDGFRRLGRRVLFTPMESLARFMFLQFRNEPSAPLKRGLHALARGLRETAEEILHCYKADAVVCVSRSDAAFLRTITCLHKVTYVETGVSDIEFGDGAASLIEPRAVQQTRPTILYVAYFGSQTNVDALQWYLDEVHPLICAKVPDYSLQVVGRGDLSRFERYSGRNVELVGQVPRLAPCISTARVGIAPALSGSGFRGKINQYALFGVPSVVSPLAAKGLAYQHGRDIMIGATATTFTAHCVELVTDLVRNQELGDRARKTCLEHYSWDSKWPAVAQIYGLASGK